MNIFLRLYKTSRLVTGFIRTIIYASVTQIYINQRRLLNKLFGVMAYLSLYIRVPPRHPEYQLTMDWQSEYQLLFWKLELLRKFEILDERKNLISEMVHSGPL